MWMSTARKVTENKVLLMGGEAVMEMSNGMRQRVYFEMWLARWKRWMTRFLRHDRELW